MADAAHERQRAAVHDPGHRGQELLGPLAVVGRGRGRRGLGAHGAHRRWARAAGVGRAGHGASDPRHPDRRQTAADALGMSLVPIDTAPAPPPAGSWRGEAPIAAAGAAAGRGGGTAGGRAALGVAELVERRPGGGAVAGGRRGQLGRRPRAAGRSRRSRSARSAATTSRR